MKSIDELRPLSAAKLLSLWKSSRDIQDPLERVLTCNARILALSAFSQGQLAYDNENQLLNDLSAHQIESLLLLLANGGGPLTAAQPPTPFDVNPAFDDSRFHALQGG